MLANVTSGHLTNASQPNASNLQDVQESGGSAPELAVFVAIAESPKKLIHFFQ